MDCGGRNITNHNIARKDQWVTKTVTTEVEKIILFLQIAFVHQIFSVKVRDFQHICGRTKIPFPPLVTNVVGMGKVKKNHDNS